MHAPKHVPPVRLGFIIAKKRQVRGDMIDMGKYTH